MYKIPSQNACVFSAPHLSLHLRFISLPRHIQVSTGIVTSATGSAQVRLGSTDVIVGVKCELGPPDAARPNAGRVVLSVECSPLASPEFKGRGGDDLAASLTRSLESLLYPAGPGKGKSLSRSLSSVALFPSPGPR